MKHTKKNVAQSVHQKLLNKAREAKRPFNELLQYYAMEKFLLRMSRSPYTNEFVLKEPILSIAPSRKSISKGKQLNAHWHPNKGWGK